MRDNLIKRPPDEEFDTMMEVQRNPTGAWMAIQSQADRIEQLEEKVAQWKAGFALADAKWGKVLMERDKAVEALRWADDHANHGAMTSTYSEGTLRYLLRNIRDRARTTLAQLEGGE